MNRHQLWIAAAAAAVLLVSGLFFFLREPGKEDSDGLGEGVTPVDETALPALEESFTANLYFPDGGVRLHPESRELPAKDSAEEQIAVLIEALLAGPRDDRLLAPLPGEIILSKVYLIDGVTVFLDLGSPNGEPPPASGSQRELLTVYSLVNTVLLNTEGPERVVLLWNGRQPPTFAGHLNTARPLAVNSSLIASSP
ncbi:MAG: GerMN domain-containing protein [Thermoanaerobaculia bacterium]